MIVNKALDLPILDFAKLHTFDIIPVFWRDLDESFLYGIIVEVCHSTV